MASIVVGIGSSHGPSLENPPSQWQRLGERDTRDPRFDYNDLLKTARPGLDREITTDVQYERHRAARSGLAVLRQLISRSKPDVLLVISNPHRLVLGNNHPVFGLNRAAKFAILRPGQPFDPDAVFAADRNVELKETVAVAGHPEFANHLLQSLIGQDFDIACTDELPDGAVLDEAYSFVHHWLLDDNVIPVVPFLLSRVLPFQASPARCYALGLALRHAIESWSADARVGLIASGGLSHQIIDEDLDRAVIKSLVDNDIDALRGLPPDRMNRAPGTPEILNWVTLAGAMSPRPMTLVDYLPCYRSLAGTGQGLTFGYWNG